MSRELRNLETKAGGVRKAIAGKYRNDRNYTRKVRAIVGTKTPAGRLYSAKLSSRQALRGKMRRLQNRKARRLG